MIDSRYRSLYQRICVDPVANALGASVSADGLTYAALIFGVIVFPLLWTGHAYVACFFLLISGYMDTLDGTVARIRGESSPKGAALDVVFDRIVEFAVILGLYAVDPEGRGWLTMGMLGGVLVCVTSFLVVGIFSQGEVQQKSFYYSIGLMERTEAFIFFIAMMLFPSVFAGLAIAFIVLIFLTAYLRVRGFRRVVGGSG